MEHPFEIFATQALCVLLEAYLSAVTLYKLETNETSM